MPVRAVFFDVGETLVDLSRIWAGWARWFEVPQEDFVASLLRRIRHGEDYLQGFQDFRPGFDLESEEAARAQAGVPNGFDGRDLYPDVVPCLTELRGQGYFVGVAGNQTLEAERVLHGLDLPADLVASSAGWGMEKPSPGFFQHIIDITRLQPAEIAYVGDRVDHDVRPARAAGMVAVFLKRGLWGTVAAEGADAAMAHLTIDSLLELPAALTSLREGEHAKPRIPA